MLNLPVVSFYKKAILNFASFKKSHNFPCGDFAFLARWMATRKISQMFVDFVSPFHFLNLIE